MRAAMQRIRISAQFGAFLPSVTVCLKGDDRYKEAFAEYASFWHLDSRASSYFPNGVQEIMKRLFPRTQ